MKLKIHLSDEIHTTMASMSDVGCCCCGSQTPFDVHGCVHLGTEFQKLWPDVLLRVQNRHFATHRNLLACHSVYFRDFFRSVRDLIPPDKYDSPVSVCLVDANAEEDDADSKSLGIDADHFSLILEWMYTGRIELTSSTAAGIFVASQKLSIEGLLQKTRRFILRYALCHTEPNDICSLLADVDPIRFKQLMATVSVRSGLNSVEPLIVDAIQLLVNEGQPFDVNLVIVSVFDSADGDPVSFEAHIGSERQPGISDICFKRSITVTEKILSKRVDQNITANNTVEEQDPVGHISSLERMTAKVRLIDSSEFSEVDVFQSLWNEPTPEANEIASSYSRGPPPPPPPPPIPSKALWAPVESDKSSMTEIKNHQTSKIPVKNQCSIECLSPGGQKFHRKSFELNDEDSLEPTDEIKVGSKSDVSLAAPTMITRPMSKLVPPRKRSAPPPPPPPQQQKMKANSQTKLSRFGWRGHSSSSVTAATGQSVSADIKAPPSK